MQPDVKIIEEVVQRVRNVVNPLRIILFGSASRGNMQSESDLDILVVVPEGTHKRKAAQHICREMIGVDIAVDVVVATENILEKHKDNWSLVYYSALRDGREIYAA